MRFPTAFLEGEKIPRVIFSMRPSTSPYHQEVSFLMEKAYEMDTWCFDLPSMKHLESFRKLRRSTNDETLMGIGHVEVEEGASFFGKPLYRFESKVISTIKKNLSPSHLPRNALPTLPSSEVLTQKEIDRITFDPLRFNKALSLFDPKESPFLLVGGRYGDWILALGRLDLLKEMIMRVREKGFTPIFLSQWTTFVLPKAKSLDVAAYAIPINQTWSLFDLTKACDLIKRFDKPVISLNPLANGSLLLKSNEAFSFLFEELKIYAAIVEIASEEEMATMIKSLKGIPSLISHRKT